MLDPGLLLLALDLVLQESLVLQLLLVSLRPGFCLLPASDSERGRPSQARRMSIYLPCWPWWWWAVVLKQHADSQLCTFAAAQCEPLTQH